jgi:hypothetical protein
MSSADQIALLAILVTAIDVLLHHVDARRTKGYEKRKLKTRHRLHSRKGKSDSKRSS